MLILYHMKDVQSWHGDFTVTSGNQAPVFLFCLPYYLASILKVILAQDG